MLWIKALHIIAVVSWYAGLLYLPRLFVYHAGATDAISQQRFVVMEKKLYWFIMTPAMLVAVGAGLMLLGYGYRGGWLAAKLFLVLLLLLFHASCYYYLRRLRGAAAHYPSPRFFRWYNEVPTVLLIAIVILVVVKPWA